MLKYDLIQTASAILVIFASVQLVAGSSVYQKVASGLTVIPADIPEGAITVNLAWNDIQVLTFESMDRLQNVRTMVLTGNQLTTIPRGIFRNSSLIEDLQLDNNRITDTGIQDTSFDYLSSLKRLNLRGNQLKALPTLTADNRRYLEFLDLGDNLITKVNHNSPTLRCESLQELHLDGNGIHTLPSGGYSRLTNLRILDLSNNNLDAVPFTFFQSFGDLDTVDVSRNQIENLEQPDRHINIRVLDLSDNKLTRINPTIFSRLTMLRILKINGN